MTGASVKDSWEVLFEVESKLQKEVVVGVNALFV